MKSFIPTSISHSDMRIYNDHKKTNNKRGHGKSFPTNTGPNSMCSIKIIDGTKRICHGTEYWVQRHVVTVKVTSLFPFDEVRIYCNKKGTQDVKHMNTLPYYGHYKSRGMIFESVFKKRLPYTSGRPETQKPIWLTAEFWQHGEIIKSCISESFFVSSKPDNERSAPHKSEISPVNSPSVIHSIKSDRNAFSSASIQTHSIAIVCPTAPISQHPNPIRCPMAVAATTPLYLVSREASMNPVNLNNESSRSPQLHFSQTSSSSPCISTVNGEPIPPLRSLFESSKLVPAVIDINPKQSPHTGGSKVYITIANFYLGDSRDITVYFGLIPATQVRILDKNVLVVNTPPRFMPGRVKVSVIVCGHEIVDTPEFQYTDNPTRLMSPTSLAAMNDNDN